MTKGTSFPEFFRAAAELKPATMLVENVGGLLRRTFRAYFGYILRRFENPFLSPKKRESWREHDERLRVCQCAMSYEQPYVVSWRRLNAADFGVPQQRKRVFIVAVRNDIGYYRFPAPTHSKQALLVDKASGKYYRRHGIPSEAPPTLQPSIAPAGQTAWRTVRDALHDLPPPASTPENAIANHWHIPGARSYTGHTGSNPDEPAKTLKAGVHGVPGGENTLTTGTNGQVRYLTLRETARIQTFPDEYLFYGTRMEMTRQIGNAVPVRLATVVARPLACMLSEGGLDL